MLVPSLPAVLLTLAAAPSPQGPILPAEHHPSGDQPVHAVAGDVTADGRPDLVVVHAAESFLAVFPSDGLGSFSARADHALAGRASEIALGAVGGGAGLDLVAAIPAEGGIAVLVDDGLGGLVPAAYHATGETPVSVALGDADGDGDLDVACARGFFGTVAYLAGDGAGGFQPPATFAAGTKAVDAAFADADLDGDLDLLVADEGGSTLRVLQGDGAGAFGAPVGFGSCAYVASLETGDLDQDGRPDAVLATHNVFGVQQQVLLGGPAGYAPAGSGGVPGTQRCAVADVDGDGDLDLAWPEISALTLQAGDGAGAFAPLAEGPIRAGIGLAAPAFADFDADGVLDAAVLAGGGAAALVRGTGGGAFADAERLALAKTPLAAAPIDADSDGVLDLALYLFVPGASGADEVALASGLGGGAFGSPATVAPLPGLGAGGFAAGDLDGDGAADLLLAHSGPSGTLHAFLGDGLGGFAAAGPFAITPGAPRALALADFDLDGALDVAAAMSAGIGVIPGDGAGGFGALLTVDAGSFFDVESADLDLDGAPDVAGAALFQKRLAAVRSDGAGGFHPPSSVPLGFEPRTVAAADLDGDGLPDLVGAGEVTPAAGRVAIVAGDGLGGFAQVAAFSSGAAPDGATVADLDADGRPDLALACRNAHRIAAFVADGAGGLSQERGFGTGFEPSALAAADVDADGLVDLVASHAQFPEVHVLLGQRPSPEGTAPFGAGTPGCAGGHGLVASGPAHVGDPGLLLLASNAPPLGSGVRLVGLGADAAGSDPVGLGVLLHVDPFVAPFLVAGTFTADAAGRGVSPLPIPPVAGLAGVTAHVQAVWLWTGPCKPTPLGLSSTAGLHVTILP